MRFYMFLTFPSSSAVQEAGGVWCVVCGVSQDQSRDCSLSSWSFAGERVRARGEATLKCVYLCQVYGGQTGLCCVVKGVTLF